MIKVVVYCKYECGRGADKITIIADAAYRKISVFAPSP
jgi:hypothetical protein